MKVKVSFTLEIDEKAWAEIHGVDAAGVREDVKSHAQYVLYETFAEVKS